MSPATAYMVMKRLEENGLLVSSVGTSDPERGGRPRRFYRVVEEAAVPLLRHDAHPLGGARTPTGSIVSPAARDGAPVLLRLSVRLLPMDVRDEVLGDLVEHWNADVRARPWLDSWSGWRVSHWR